MSKSHFTGRIFILGAGFSRAAGLPLATELFDLVKASIERKYDYQTKFHGDLEKYLLYRYNCKGVPKDTPVNLEDFMSYLDVEHFLWLKGKDTWSEDGNEAQLMIRKAIGEVIHSATPNIAELPEVYYQFAEQLNPSDVVITFNYDLILEMAIKK